MSAAGEAESSDIELEIDFASSSSSSPGAADLSSSATRVSANYPCSETTRKSFGWLGRVLLHELPISKPPGSNAPAADRL